METTAVNITPDSDLNNLEIKHKDVLKEILKLVAPINFRDRAGLTSEQSPKKKHFQIIVVEEVLQLAKVHKFGLCRKLDFFYSYNGTFWRLLDPSELKDFLGKAAEKAGVQKFDAKHYQFQDELFKQFQVSAHLPEPERPEGETLINLANGTLKIGKSISLKDHNSKNFLTYLLPYSYDPQATAPLFIQYLNEVLPDLSAQKVLAEFLGYVFIKNSFLKLEKALLLYGSGANGKSVMFEIVRAVLGNENLSSYSLSSLTDTSGYYRAEIANRLVNYASEISGNLEAARFKALVSGEPIEARRPYGTAFILEDYARLVFNTNELPRDVEHTAAFFRRFLIIPFTKTIPEERQDKELASKIIKNELPGVFIWILEGLQRVLENRNFSRCELAEKELSKFRKESDSVEMFLEDSGLVKDSESFRPVKELYSDYRSYCLEDGYKAVGKKNFIKRLESLGIPIERKNIGMAAFLIIDNSLKNG